MAHLQCISCGNVTALDPSALQCTVCGGLLEVHHGASATELTRDVLAARRASWHGPDRSGVWRFREWILPVDEKAIVTLPEGNTNLYDAPRLAARVGVRRLGLKHEGENPTGSFKDRGMTCAITMAKAAGFTRVACASTGNTSASMAAYAARAGMEAIVLIPSGKVAFGKLSQALAYGARTVRIDGSFDDALREVRALSAELGIALLNSVNPFRIEGQKAIVFELLEQRGWQVPDWIVVPGGNLGNSTAIAKGLAELHAAGLIDRLPRMAVVQAHGANPLARHRRDGHPWEPVMHPETRATAIRIGDPVSWRKCLAGLDALDGIVEDVTDQEILDAKALVDREGVGAEPASCASVAGLQKLRGMGVIAEDADVVCILTGHVLKDPDATVEYHRGTLEGIASTHANAIVDAPAEREALRALLR
ncbi:MAG: threonine synthase [Deltaproteobacteria bacterium]|nr:MAG: threonine synthase [Deltaproteobacteria bacterium]